MRYIDGDKIEYEILHTDFEVVKHECKDYESYVNGANCFRSKAKNLINNAPTEDVVPRAEVERWQYKYKADIETCDSTIHRLQNILLQFTDIVHKWGAKNNIDTTEISLVPILEQEADSIIDKNKQEVAKQIFDEFESHISTGIRILKDCINDTDTDQVKRHLLGRLHELCGMEKFIAELRKKYIGE